MLNKEFLRLGALALAPDQKAEPFSAAAWSEAAQMTLMGMAMIFAVLAILWGVLVIFKLIFAGKTANSKKSDSVKPVTVEAPAPAPAPIANESNDAELIAILTAAIAAYEAEQNPDAEPVNFRVVSYRRVNGGRSWNAK